MTGSPDDIEQQKLDFEREKFLFDKQMRERETSLEEKKEKKAAWNNPFYITITAAILTLAGNAIVSLVNNRAQVSIERQKAEAARILEVIKVNDQEQVKKNLLFLIGTGLIQNDTDKIGNYLRTIKTEDLPLLSSASFQNSQSPYNQKYIPFGIPSDHTQNFARLGYAFGFDVEKKMPGWVMYILSPDIFKPDRPPRIDNFRIDPFIPPESQLNDLWYRKHDGASKYYRGHLVSSSDVVGIDSIMAQVNFFSVTLPMTPRLVLGLWRILENRSRTFVRDHQGETHW